MDGRITTGKTSNLIMVRTMAKIMVGTTVGTMAEITVKIMDGITARTTIHTTDKINNGATNNFSNVTKIFKMDMVEIGSSRTEIFPIGTTIIFKEMEINTKIINARNRNLRRVAASSSKIN